MTEPRRPVMPDRANLEIRVEPVIRCSRCGDPLAFGRIGRCDDCTGRRGDPIGCLLLAILAILAITLAVLVGSSIATSQGASDVAPALPGTPRSITPSLSGIASWSVSEVGSDAPYPADQQDSAGGGVPPTVLGAMVEGKATWFRTSGLTGAAGPVLRDALGDWRGEHVTVCASRCVTVVLTDVCACGERGDEPTLIDLSDGAFARLGPLSAGVIDVTIEVGGSRPTLPATDLP